MHTRYLDGILLVTPKGRLDEGTCRLLPFDDHRSWSTVDADQHILVAYQRQGRMPVAIARLRRVGARAEITCFAAVTRPAPGRIIVRELEALARAAGIRELRIAFKSLVGEEQ